MQKKPPEPKQIRPIPTPKQSLALKWLWEGEKQEVLYGGAAGSGKSWVGCNAIIAPALKYPGTRWLVGRAVLKTLKETTLNTFFEICRQYNLGANVWKLNAQSNVIKLHNGSEILLKDLATTPSDPNHDELGSLELTGAFIDECNQVSHRCKEVVKSRIRYKLDEYNLKPMLLMTCNPAKNWVYQEFYQPWREGTLPEHRAFIPALATDNPYISAHYIESLQQMKDQALKERLLYGNWDYDDDPAKLFEVDAINDLFSNYIDDDNTRFITGDIARFGKDQTVLMVWHGLNCVEIKCIEYAPLDVQAKLIERLREQHQVPLSNVHLDEQGLGGGLIDMLGCKGFIASSRPLDEANTNYSNLRAQSFYILSELVKSRKMRIRSEQYKEVIAEELYQIKRDKIDTDGKLKILPKEKIKESLGRSPDFADCLMIRASLEAKVPQPIVYRDPLEWMHSLRW